MRKTFLFEYESFFIVIRLSINYKLKQNLIKIKQIL